MKKYKYYEILHTIKELGIGICSIPARRSNIGIAAQTFHRLYNLGSIKKFPLITKFLDQEGIEYETSINEENERIVYIEADLT